MTWGLVTYVLFPMLWLNCSFKMHLILTQTVEWQNLFKWDITSHMDRETFSHAAMHKISATVTKSTPDRAFAQQFSDFHKYYAGKLEGASYAYVWRHGRVINECCFSKAVGCKWVSRLAD